MRLPAAISLLALCGACAGPAGGPSPVGGVASYDALKHAQDACAAKGGQLVQQTQSSGKRMSDFACKRK
jgi:hypothetical protein